MKALELRRHAEREKDVDALSAEGRTHAESVGRSLPTDFAVVFVSPAKRAAETVAWFLRGSGQPVPSHGVVPGLGSAVEDRWRAAATSAGTSRVDVVAETDPGLVADESGRLAEVIRELFAQIPDGGVGLAVGHTPLIEAGVYGLLTLVIEPLAECEGVHLTLDDHGDFRVQELRLPTA